MSISWRSTVRHWLCKMRSILGFTDIKWQRCKGCRINKLFARLDLAIYNFFYIKQKHRITFSWCSTRMFGLAVLKHTNNYITLAILLFTKLLRSIANMRLIACCWNRSLCSRTQTLARRIVHKINQVNSNVNIRNSFHVRVERCLAPARDAVWSSGVMRPADRCLADDWQVTIPHYDWQRRRSSAVLIDHWQRPEITIAVLYACRAA